MIYKIKRQLKKYRKADFDVNSYLAKYYIEKERAVIPIKIERKEDLFSRFDPKHIIINPEIISYIESIVYYIPYEFNITLNICGVQYTDDEKEQIVAALDSSFGLVAHDKKVDLFYNDKKAYILFVLGFIFLSLSYLLGQVLEIKFIFEAVSIVGTFSIWEFVDTIWFSKGNLKIASLNAGQLACSKITFNEE